MRTKSNPMNDGHATGSTTAPRRWMQRAATCALAVMAAFSFPACQQSAPVMPIPSEAAASRPSGVLAAGDQINIAFSGAPEMNTKQTIAANGKVSLPVVGDVQASGRSITSLQADLTSRYQSHLQDPTVVVSLETASTGVYVTGEVLRPGKIPLYRPMTAMEAVMEAGGFTKFANPKQVIVVRTQGNRSQRYVLNMNDALAGYEPSPFYVRPYDVVYVKQSVW